MANKNPTGGEQGLPISTKLLSFLAITSICILQYQIEKTGIERASTNKQILRIVSIVVILAVGYVPWRLETKDFSSKWPLFYILNGVMISIFFSVLPPILFVTSHHYIRKFAILKIRSIISKFHIPGFAKLTMALHTSKTTPMIYDRDGGTRGAHDPPDFCRSGNPISTRGGRLFLPIITRPQRFSYLPPSLYDVIV